MFKKLLVNGKVTKFVKKNKIKTNINENKL